MVSVGVLAALLVLLCKQMEAMAAAEPGPWVGRGSPTTANRGWPTGSSSGAAAAEVVTGAVAPSVTSAPAPAPEPEEALVCVADATPPTRFRVQLGRLCGDKGWTQRFLFMGSLSEGPGKEAVCISSATSPWRFRLTRGSSCSDLEWKQVSVFYLHTERGAARVPVCVAEAQDPSRFRVATALNCGDREWKQRFVLYTVPSHSLRSQAMAANAQKVAGSDLDLLRASRAETDMLHALLEEMPVDVLRTHSLWKASVMMRRAYYKMAYASQVDPGGDKEKNGLMHTWDAETLARRWLHCQGLLRDQTDVHDCAAAASASAAQPVERTCAAAPGSTSPSAFLLPWNMQVEGPQLCVARDKGGPLWGELKRDKCASTRKLAEELLDRTHDGDKRLNEAEGRLDGCPTCAVVGSSGNLLNQALGAEIDGHDVVMRINCAPTLGFSVDVGTKTTHRIFYPEASWFAAPQDEPCAQLTDLGSEETSLLAILFKPPDVEWWHHVVSGTPPPKEGFWHPVPVKMSVPGVRVAVVSPSWLNHATAGLSALQKSLGVEPKKDGWPSSGLMGMLLALQQCRSVNIYGFGHHFRNGSQLDASMNKYYM